MTATDIAIIIGALSLGIVRIIQAWRDRKEQKAENAGLKKDVGEVHQIVNSQRTAMEVKLGVAQDDISNLKEEIRGLHTIILANATKPPGG